MTDVKKTWSDAARAAAAAAHRTAAQAHETAHTKWGKVRNEDSNAGDEALDHSERAHDASRIANAAYHDDAAESAHHDFDDAYTRGERRKGHLHSARIHNDIADRLEGKMQKSDDEDVENVFEILKADDDQRMVWGWASISTKKGLPVSDLQNDQIDTAELQNAAHDFMKNYRTGGNMHESMDAGTVVESMVFTDALQKALGVDLGFEGWLIGLKVADNKVWKQVKDGTLKAFSIGGSAQREEVGKGAQAGTAGSALSRSDGEDRLSQDDDVIEKKWSDAARAAAAQARRKAGVHEGHRVEAHEHLQTLDNKTLTSLDGTSLSALSRQELAGRGVDPSGKWVGFDRALAAHGLSQHIDTGVHAQGQHIQTFSQNALQYLGSHPHVAAEAHSRELANRGIDESGKWVGFDHADAQHERRVSRLR